MKSRCHGHAAHGFFHGLFAILLGSLAVMLLWNWLLPALFSFREIGYFQAAGILVLSRLLSGSLCGKHGHCNSCGHGNGHSLTQEERNQLHERFHEKWFGCKKHSKPGEDSNGQSA